MRWRRLLFLVALLFAFTACNQDAQQKGIGSKRARPTVVVPAGPPTVVGIAELVERPEMYTNELVRVTGQYRRAPVIVCDGLTRLSPATWALAEGEQIINLRNFENLVQPLLPPRLMMTVDGVYRHWRGPVGCGKEAPVQDVWYLAVTNIVAPNPVARVTLTPEGQVANVTPEVGGESPTPTLTQEAPEPVGTPITIDTPLPASTPTNPPATPTPTTGPATPTPTTGTGATPIATATPVMTGTVQASPTTGVGTATATATPTPTPDNTTPTATPAVAIEDKGAIGFQELRGDQLNSNETHSWQFDVRAGDIITVSVASGLESDMTITILDAAGNRIVDQDNSGIGQVERVEALTAQNTGAYRVVLSEVERRETDYVMILLNDNYEDYENYIFVNALRFGASQTIRMEANSDHFWFFYGETGNVINFNISPNDQSNVAYELFDPDGNRLLPPPNEPAFVNDAGSGSAEQLLNYRLPRTGLYSVRVGEWNRQVSNYTILVVRN